MNPFQQAEIPDEEIRLQVKALQQAWEKDKFKSQIGREATDQEYSAAMADVMMAVNATVFLNDVYQVMISPATQELLEISIKRRDRKPIHNWRDFQIIKSELVGPENEAFEIYPAESRLLDSANQYYLWCYRDPTHRIPVGSSERIVSDVPLGKSVNAPIEKADAKV